MQVSFYFLTTMKLTQKTIKDLKQRHGDGTDFPPPNERMKDPLTQFVPIAQSFEKAKKIFSYDDGCIGCEINTDFGLVYFQKTPFKACFSNKAKKNAFGDFLHF